MDEIAFRDDAVDRLSVTRDNQRTDTCIAQSLYRGFYCGRGRDRIDLAALVLKYLRNLHNVISLKYFSDYTTHGDLGSNGTRKMARIII